MMKLSKKITYSIFASSISIVSGFVRNKIFAIYLSLSLFGILSLGQQFVSLLYTVFAFGLPLGISTYASGISAQNIDSQRVVISRILAVILSIASGVFLLLLLLLFAAPVSVGSIIVNSKEYDLSISILLFAAPFMIIHNCVLALMEGMGLVTKVVQYKTIPAVIVVPMVLLLVHQYQLTGAAIGVVVSEFCFTLVSLFLLREYINAVHNFSAFVGTFLEIGKTALLSLIVGSISIATDVLTKRYLLGIFGEESNGIIQSVAKVTDLYPTVILSWLTMHLFPLMSSQAHDKNAVVGHLRRTMTISAVIIIPVIGILFVFKTQILNILYQREFVVAQRYFAAMLILGLPRVLSWVMGVPLLPLGMRKVWFWSSLSFTLVYSIGIVLCVQFGCGIYAIPVATLVGYLVQYIITLAVYHVSGFKFSRTFVGENVLYFAITTSFTLAFWYDEGLVAVVVLYTYLLIKFDVYKEFITRIKTYLEYETK